MANPTDRTTDTPTKILHHTNRIRRNDTRTPMAQEIQPCNQLEYAYNHYWKDNHQLNNQQRTNASHQEILHTSNFSPNYS